MSMFGSPRGRRVTARAADSIIPTQPRFSAMLSSAPIAPEQLDPPSAFIRVAARANVSRADRHGLPSPDTCIVPTPGLGRAELDRRINASAERSAFRHRDFFSLPAIEDRAELLSNSWPGARNDIKSHVKGAGDYGNFLFGAEAAARGMSLEEAHNWAEKAQIFQDLSNKKLPTGRDNKGDPEQIARGYNYYMAGCSKP